MEPKPVLEAENLVRSYDLAGSEFKALAGVDLTVRQGEFLTITGPSGSGKSTLLYILGLLDRATGGSLSLDGVRSESLDDRDLSRLRNGKIGFVFQSFNLIPTATVQENVEIPLMYGRVHRKERKSRARKMLQAVGLGDKLRSRPTQLSGGQMQRVAIARALVNRPSLILADEPTGNLDTRTGLEIMTLLRLLHHQGTTLIVVTHDPGLAAMSERMVRIVDGQVEVDRPVDNGSTPELDLDGEEARRLSRAIAD